MAISPIPSSSTLPIISLDAFLASPTSSEAQAEAIRCAEALVQYGALIVKDSRVSEADNETFLDLQEDYWNQSQEELERDCRPEYHYQVGATLEHTEKPKCHADATCIAVVEGLAPEERPIDPTGAKADPKCRFFYRMGRSPPKTDFPSLSMSNVIPAVFSSTWDSQMSAWGQHLKTSVEGVALMLGNGLGVGDAFLKAGEFGPHLLAPTATRLDKYGKVGEVFAGFHSDLGFLTIHGRSRYPVSSFFFSFDQCRVSEGSIRFLATQGLHIWARNGGKRIAVKMPPGHLLIQAGKQLEHITGGLILAGFHEVVCTPATVAAMSARSLSHPSRPQIRISSTFFWHLGSDYELNAAEFSKQVAVPPGVVVAENEPRKEYEVMKVGTHMQIELGLISLLKE